MPTLEVEDQDVQVILNALALQNPLIRKISEQMQKQQQGRFAKEDADGKSPPRP